MNISKLLKNDIFYVFVVSLLIGLVIGFSCPMKLRIFVHNIYVKFHPNIEKDSKTIIMETATKNAKPIPQNSIFEEPKKENSVIIFIKKIFVKEKKNSEMTINDVVIN